MNANVVMPRQWKETPETRNVSEVFFFQGKFAILNSLPPASNSILRSKI